VKVGDLMKYVTRRGDILIVLVLEIDVDYARCIGPRYDAWFSRDMLEVINESR